MSILDENGDEVRYNLDYDGSRTRAGGGNDGAGARGGQGGRGGNQGGGGAGGRGGAQ
jgi:hypothetical protein